MSEGTKGGVVTEGSQLRLTLRAFTRGAGSGSPSPKGNHMIPIHFAPEVICTLPLAVFTFLAAIVAAGIG